MPSVLRASGIILRNTPHGETSAILNLFTREVGKLGLLAKGVRARKKNGSQAALELCTELQVVYYHKATREIQLVKEFDITGAHLGLRKNWPALATACAVIEFLSKCTRESDPHPDLFDATVETLEGLDTRPRFPQALLWRFQIILLPALGLALAVDQCPVTGARLRPPFVAPLRYRLDDGSFLHPDADRTARMDGKLSPAAFAVLASLQNSTVQFASRVMASPSTASEITDFIVRYIETHLPVRGQLRSLRALLW